MKTTGEPYNMKTIKESCMNTITLEPYNINTTGECYNMNTEKEESCQTITKPHTKKMNNSIT